jgi:hypothetical protein
MSKLKTALLPKNAYIHIDKIHVTGPCRHAPRGRLFFTYDEELGLVPRGAAPDKRQTRRGEDRPYVRSRNVQKDHVAQTHIAHEIEIQCCPPKVLQKHNVFGHSSVADYVHEVFDTVTRAQGIEVNSEDREEWRLGHVWLTQIHLTANFCCPASCVRPIIDAIDENNAEGKHRDGKLCITLGFSESRRSVHDALTIYYKNRQLTGEWKHPGSYQSRLLDWTQDSIRAEVKLYRHGLRRRKLQRVADWQNVDVAALFFEILHSYKITYAIQRSPDDEQLAALNKRELAVYHLWLKGHPLSDHFGRTTAWKYAKSIKAKIGIDVSGERRPEPQPKINLPDSFRPENVKPIPDWAFGTPFYAPPTAAIAPITLGTHDIGDAPLLPAVSMNLEADLAWERG